MPSHKRESYFCELCGAEVVVKNGGDGTLNCCRQKMKYKED